MALGRDVRDNDFGGPRRLPVAAAIGIADHLIRGGYIDVLRFVTWRMECDAERPLQLLGEDFRCGRPAFRSGGGEHQDSPALAFGDENIAVRRDPDDARLLQSLGERLHGKAVRHVRRLALRCLDHLRHELEIRLLGVVLMMAWRRQVGGLDVATDAGGVVLPGAEGFGAGAHLLGGHWRKQSERERKS
jgi:hypothetical protein